MKVWQGAIWASLNPEITKWGTDDAFIFPQFYGQTVTLASGVYKIGFGGGGEALYYSPFGSTVSCTRNTPGGTVTTSVQYVSRTAGRSAFPNTRPGAAFITIQAETNSGAVNTLDASTVDVLLRNF